MPPPLDHPGDCGCQVCREYRQRLEVDPRAREIDASYADDDPHAVEVVEWEDPDQNDAGEQRVVVEHHHEVPSRPSKDGRDGKDGERGRDGKDGKPGRRGRTRRGGFLRTVAAGVILIWLLQSFYPELDVPLVPGIACTSGEVTGAVDVDPALGLPFVDLDLGAKLGDLAEETVGRAVKGVALAAAGGALHLAGVTLRAMASHPPTVDGIREGLRSDVETVGKVVGFTAGALTGEDVGSLVDLNMGTPVVDGGGCTPCSTGGGTSEVGTSGGVETAARAALAAGWTGEDAVTAVAVAGAESGYNPKAANATSTARGLWQTMMSYHASKYRGASWTDPAANARVAHQIYESQGWGAWTVYTSGAYRSHLDEARAAIATLTKQTGASGNDTLRPVASGTATVDDPRVSDGGSVPTQPVALKAASFIRSQFGFTGTIGGSADSGHITNSLHYRGLALDVMTSGAAGQRIYDYFAGPGYKPFGVDNVIFEHRIFNAGRGDHTYSADDHMDHVHVDFHAAGGRGATPAAGNASAACSVTPVGEVASGGWRVGTFNILGASHTPGRWRQRWSGVPALLGQTGLSVAGLQEVHPEQRPLLNAMPGWESFGDWDAVTTWRTDTWTLVAKRYVRVPLYPGRSRLEPLIQLRHRSGTSVWFLNVHNSRIPRLQIRDERLEHAAVRDLAGPVVWLGDTNDRRFRPWASRSGFDTAGTTGIDQIVGAGGVNLTGGTRLPKTGVVARTSDHTLVYADLRLGKAL